MSEPIAYQEIPGVPGQYFDCPHGCGLLSVASCARSYKEAPAVFAASARLARCVGCAVGAVHAGDKAPTPPALRVHTCVRCRRSVEDLATNQRIAGRLRLVRGAVCVSCYNREREVAKGRNGKGSRPVKWQSLHPDAVAVCCEGKSRVRQFPMVADHLEAALTAIRQNPGCAVGWVSRSAVVRG